MKVSYPNVPHQHSLEAHGAINIKSKFGVGLNKLQASVLSVSELQSNPIYVSAKMRICSTRVNLNKQAVTKEFIEDIGVNKADYVGLPLYADIRRLTAKDYARLGHLYDPSNGKFYTDQIGTFVDFEVVEDEYGTSLIGEARISKRNDEICEAIVELFNLGRLKISFEVFYADFVKDNNGVTIINKSDRNRLISACVVTTPAYPEASTLALVAERNTGANVGFNASEYNNAEVSLETLMRWFYMFLDANEFADDLAIERIGPDFAILYSVGMGKTYKIDFAVMPEGLDVLAFYEVELVRKLDLKGINDMLNDKATAEQAEVIVDETAVPAEVVQPEDVKSEEVVATSTETVEIVLDGEPAEEVTDAESVDVAETDEVAEPGEEVPAEEPAPETGNASVNFATILEKLQSIASRLDALEASATAVAEVTPEVAIASEDAARVDAPDKGDQFQDNVNEAEARQQENRERMTQLAEARGFDVKSEPVAKAIEALDYAKLMECENNVMSAATTINGVADDIKVGGSVHPSLEKA